ncbi:UNVERIFIED_CONTAM: hypothetical protein Cloal_3565 [Acetivibrio alkalicellulosi]
MDTIYQTNRSILFEEINPTKVDLLTIIGDIEGVDSLDDEKIKEINRHLLVSDFDEFLEKFSPTVYSFYNVIEESEGRRIVYALKKPESIPDEYISEIRLDYKNDFLKMLFTLIDTKRNNEPINVDFKFERVLEMMSPKKVIDDIRKVRKEIHDLFEKYSQLEGSDFESIDLEKKLKLKFEEASINFNNVIAMLPLVIDDIKTRLLNGDSEVGTKLVKMGMVAVQGGGDLKVIEAPREDQKVFISNKSRSILVDLITREYNEFSKYPSSYVKALVVKTFCPTSSDTTEIDVDREIQNYNSYIEFYANAKDDFIKVAKPLIEKILGVKLYFDQYNCKSEGMKPSLLVANIKLEMIAKSNYRSRLDTYLRTVNDKNDFSNTIWYGIVPNIEIESTGKPKVSKIIFKGNKEVKKEANSMESLANILEILKNHKVQVFFNFQTSDETDFKNLASKGIEKYFEKCQYLMRQDYSEFAIPCIPNFTIIPKDKSAIIIGNFLEKTGDGEVRVSDTKDGALKIWIHGVYVDAAYVAAGIVGAFQCPKYLKEHMENVSEKYPGIRLDIEDKDNYLRIVTTMEKEIPGFSDSISDQIDGRNFGFVFSSDNAEVDGKDVKRITVFKARNLLQRDEGFEPIYRTLVSMYIERILRYYSNDFKQDNIEMFFSSNPNSQKRKWINDSGYINSIIQDGDELNYKINKTSKLCRVDIVFNGNIKKFEVSISKKTSVTKRSKIDNNEN